MQFVIIDTSTLAEIDENWETRRKSNDGTKAIIHKEILDSLMPQVMNLNLTYDDDGNPIQEENPYPFPIVSGDEINQMAEFQSKEPLDKV